MDNVIYIILGDGRVAKFRRVRRNWLYLTVGFLEDDWLRDPADQLPDPDPDGFEWPPSTVELTLPGDLDSPNVRIRATRIGWRLDGGSVYESQDEMPICGRCERPLHGFYDDPWEQELCWFCEQDWLDEQRS